MSRSESEPPREAVTLVNDMMWEETGGQWREYFGNDLLLTLRTLPAAARWRLIGWLAEGLEPLGSMLCAGDATKTPRRAFEAMMAAAREGSGDGG